MQVPYNQGVLSRARKSGSTGIETELEDNGKHEKVSFINELYFFP